jgi:hypothetical protein
MIATLRKWEQNIICTQRIPKEKLGKPVVKSTSALPLRFFTYGLAKTPNTPSQTQCHNHNEITPTNHPETNPQIPMTPSIKFIE